MNFVEKIEQAKDTISTALKTWPHLTVACSFGKDSVVTLDLCLQIKPDIDIFTVMTPFKPKETLVYKDYMTANWLKRPIREFMVPATSAPDKHWQTEPEDCCRIFKVEPTRKALEGYDAWITGLRSTEGWTRAGLAHIEKNQSPVKVNPILEWTELDVWRYLAVRELPVNPLYGQGYRSLGCAPCSRISESDDLPERAGRWVGTAKCGGECGIHSLPMRTS